MNRWCGYCSNPPKKLCGKCDLCHNKSFASHYRANNWSDKNNIGLKMVFKSSHKEYIFDCECGHEFKARLSDIINKNSWCPYCSNPPKKLCENIQSCLSCQNKTFALVERSKIGLQKTKRNQLKFLKALLKYLCLIVIIVILNLEVNYVILQMDLGAQIVDIKQKKN